MRQSNYLPPQLLVELRALGRGLGGVFLEQIAPGRPLRFSRLCLAVLFQYMQFLSFCGDDQNTIKSTEFTVGCCIGLYIGLGLGLATIIYYR